MSRASSVGTPNTGFRNVAVPNRNDRKAASDKEGLEKSRLAERKEGFQRWQDPGRVTEVSETGLGYAPASARYMTGAASELKAQRDAVIDDRERKYHRARLINLQKEEDRWQVCGCCLISHARCTSVEQVRHSGTRPRGRGSPGNIMLCELALSSACACSDLI